MFITMGLVYKPALEAEKVLGNVGGGRLEADAGERVPLERFLEAIGSTSVESFHAVALGFKGPWKLRERGPAAPQSLSPLTATWGRDIIAMGSASSVTGCISRVEVGTVDAGNDAVATGIVAIALLERWSQFVADEVGCCRSAREPGGVCSASRALSILVVVVAANSAMMLSPRGVSFSCVIRASNSGVSC